MAIEYKNVINGRFCKLWWNNEEIGEVKSFSATIKIDREDVKFNKSFKKGSKLKDMSGEGTFVLYHVYTRGMNDMLNSYKNGEDVVFKITSSSEDKDQVNGQIEKINIGTAWLNELVLADWEQDKILECSYSYGFDPSSANFLDTID